jgi:hypothetical protein
LGGYNAKPIFEAMGNLRKRKIIAEDRTFAVHYIARPFTEKWHCFPKDSSSNGGVTSKLSAKRKGREYNLLFLFFARAEEENKNKNISAVLDP